MKLAKIHIFFELICLVSIPIFFLSSVFSELYGNEYLIQIVKRNILYSMIYFIPCIMLTGITGGLMGRLHPKELTVNKKYRMKLIALNGLFFLLPSAFYLSHLANIKNFGTSFYIFQSVEFIAGITNFILFLLNFIEGIKLSRSLSISRSVTTCPS